MRLDVAVWRVNRRVGYCFGSWELFRWDFLVASTVGFGRHNGVEKAGSVWYLDYVVCAERVALVGNFWHSVFAGLLLVWDILVAALWVRLGFHECWQNCWCC